MKIASQLLNLTPSANVKTSSSSDSATEFSSALTAAAAKDTSGDEISQTKVKPQTQGAKSQPTDAKKKSVASDPTTTETAVPASMSKDFVAVTATQFVLPVTSFNEAPTQTSVPASTDTQSGGDSVGSASSFVSSLASVSTAVQLQGSIMSPVVAGHQKTDEKMSVAAPSTTSSEPSVSNAAGKTTSSSTVADPTSATTPTVSTTSVPATAAPTAAPSAMPVAGITQVAAAPAVSVAVAPIAKQPIESSPVNTRSVITSPAVAEPLNATVAVPATVPPVSAAPGLAATSTVAPVPAQTSTTTSEATNRSSLKTALASTVTSLATSSPVAISQTGSTPATASQTASKPVEAVQTVAAPVANASTVQAPAPQAIPSAEAASPKASSNDHAADSTKSIDTSNSAAAFSAVDPAVLANQQTAAITQSVTGPVSLPGVGSMEQYYSTASTATRTVSNVGKVAESTNDTSSRQVLSGAKGKPASSSSNAFSKVSEDDDSDGQTVTTPAFNSSVVIKAPEAAGSVSQGSSEAASVVSPATLQAMIQPTQPVVSNQVHQAATQDASTTAQPTAQGVPGQAHLDVPSTQGVSSAQLIQSMRSSEMKLGMQSAEFGNISISTSLNHQAISAQISIDHSELGKALAVHLPAIEEKLGSAYGMQAKVELRDTNNPSSSNDSGYSNPGQQSREQRQSQGSGYATASSTTFDSTASASARTNFTATPAIANTSRLDIRI